MDKQIPIVVTKQGTKNGQFCFKFASPHLVERLKFQHDRLKSPKQRQTHDYKKTQTLQKREPSAVPRTRRISSSAAARRFPKDFFKGQCRLQPIAHKTDKKSHHPNMLDTFSQKYFPLCDQFHNISKQTLKSQGTPEFKSNKSISKIINDSVQTTNNKPNLNESLPQVNQYRSLKQPHTQQKQNSLDGPKAPQMKDITSQFSNFNVTLGQKINIAMIFRKEKERKRIEMIKQKQNRMQQAFGLRGLMVKAEGGFRIRRKI